jgi:hypothetical protein
MKTPSITRLLLAAMLVTSVIATGCGQSKDSKEAESWKELAAKQAANAKAKAAEVPAEKDPECVRQNESRRKGEITWAQMTERCSRAFNGPISAPGGS